MAELILRDYQSKSIDDLRNGFAQGHNSQLLYGPCAFGKTEVAISLMKAAADKGHRSAMVMDRRVLCEQTSQRLDSYFLDHGVLMAGHPRFLTYKTIQICSAQTLEKRASFPNIKLLIVDEVHQIRKQTIELIKNNPQIKVIGLTGSPFTKGLGKIFSNVVSSVTIKELVNTGRLCPLRVFVAKEIDMTGAKKIAGEWSSQETTERGIKITGDIVQEWIKKTHEIFGEPRKTIVFCSGVAHGLDLAEKFKQAGYNFISISYKDDDEYKQQAIADFEKPGSGIHGLIATDILTKGFSCILEGSSVLTDKGHVAIDKLSLGSKIWNGREFVSHGGAIYRGFKDVITYAGLTATPDHRVKTESGWMSFGECADRNIPIITTGLNGSAIQECDGYFTDGLSSFWKKNKPSNDSLQVLGLRSRVNNCFVGFTDTAMAWVSKMQASTMAFSKDSRHEGQVRKQKPQGLSWLWRAWDKIQFSINHQSGYMDSEKSWITGELQEHGTGQDRQQRTLSKREFTLGNWAIKSKQYATRRMGGEKSFIQNKSSRNPLCRQNIKEFIYSWVHPRTNNRKVLQTFGQAKGRVWDILKADNGNCFTCNGLLVHNCDDVEIMVSARPFTKSFSSHVQQLGRGMRSYPGKEFCVLLDHSGNFLRFQDQWEELYSSGVSELDDGAEKPKKEPTDKEKEAAKCPNCGGLWQTSTDTCTHCGHTRVRVNQVVDVPGELQEIKIGKARIADNAEQFYQMCCKYARENSTPDKQKGRAYYLYKGIMGTDPRWNFDKTKSHEISSAFMGKITQQNIAFAKGRAKGKASA
jgi:superfamily II DNA or RNA helicase